MGGHASSDTKSSALTLSRILGCQPDDLPTLPTTAVELVETTNRRDADAEDLVKIINHDPSLAARLLRMANSPVYMVSEEVVDLRRAVVVLGFAEISRLAMALTVLTAAGGDRPLRRRMQRLKLWKHSQAVGFICDSLAREVLGWGPGYYIFGLVHDIGKVALDYHRPEKFTEVLNLIESKGIPWTMAENETLMLDHGFVGLSLMDFWELPRELVEAVGHHHDPWNAPEEHRERAALVFLADYMARLMGYYSFDGEKNVELASTIEPRMSEFLKTVPWAVDALKSQDVKSRLKDMMAKLTDEGF